MTARVGIKKDPTELVHALVDRFRQRFAAVAFEFDLTPPQMGVLLALDDSQSMSGLASAMHCDNSNITWMTDRLEQRGIVERRADPSDRRVKRLVLTESGRKLRRAIDRRLGGVVNIGKLSSNEQQVLAELLERILED